MNEYPEKFMTNVYWSFSDTEQYYTLTAFNAAVYNYYQEVNVDSDWEPNQLVLNVPFVQIQYLYMEYDNFENDYIEVEPIITLEADNGENFTAGELLYKVHNTVSENITNTSAHFFEGFILYEESKDKEVPLYFLICGS